MRSVWAWGLAALAGANPQQGRSPTGCRDAAPSRPSGAPTPASAGDRQPERDRLVQELVAQDIHDGRVLGAMRKVPRHRFVPAVQQHRAYEDIPLPIGHGQTISQPFVVAYMSEAAKPTDRDRCLEIGTGSGYQAAILAELCGAVYSIEYLEPVARLGERNLRDTGYGPERVRLRVGDGYDGWPEAAPFQVVLVTAGAKAVPQPLLDQLAVGGRLVIPVGKSLFGQRLELWTRLQPGRGPGAFRVDELLDVRFVPFLGKGAKN